MKKNMYWFIMAVAVIMSAMTFVSCEDPFEEVLPEVIESEVLDEGVEEEIIETPSVDPEGTNTGTELSYKSWIMVKGQTRAAFEERVEVTLTNVFNNTDTTLVVDNFDLGEYTTSLSHKVRKTREEGFVDIVDSVLVYTVSFENFSFDYELDYEVATYDDGYTRQVMPYHQIGTIKDKGYKLEDLDFVIDYADNQKVYLRKLLVHEISVDFQGKTYDLTAKVELRRFVGYHPCVVKSEPISQAVSITDDIVESKLVVRRTWSDGKVEEDPIVCYFGAYIECVAYDYKIIHNYKNDLAIVSSGFSSNVTTEPRSTNAKYVTCTRYYQDWCVNYNYFDIAIKFVHDEAVYDDGILKCNMPGAGSITDVVNATPIMDAFFVGEDENGKYTVYQFKQDVSAKLGDISLSGWGTMEITAYE